MSGRVQKECADDPDRIDDAVDPRVQVRLAFRRASQRHPRDDFRDIDISQLEEKKTAAINCT